MPIIRDVIYFTFLLERDYFLNFQYNWKISEIDCKDVLELGNVHKRNLMTEITKKSVMS